jgi:hypothetical protein
MAGLPFTIPGTIRPAAFCTRSTRSLIASFAIVELFAQFCGRSPPAPSWGTLSQDLWKETARAQSSTRGDKLSQLKNQSQSGEPNNMADAKVLSNQKTILANQATIVKNQKAILSNQKTIVKNQRTLLTNQGTIKKNQSALSEILNNQKEILAAVKK